MVFLEMNEPQEYLKRASFTNDHNQLVHGHVQLGHGDWQHVVVCFPSISRVTAVSAELVELLIRAKLSQTPELTDAVEGTLPPDYILVMVW